MAQFHLHPGCVQDFRLRCCITEGLSRKRDYLGTEVSHRVFSPDVWQNLRVSPVETLKRSDRFGLQILLQLSANSANSETSRGIEDTKDWG